MTVANDFESLMSGMGVTRMDDTKGRKPKASKRKVAVKSAAKGAPKKPAVKKDSERVAELERALLHIKEERSAAEAKVQTLKKRVKRLKGKLAEAELELAQPRSTVAQTLSEWGFETPDERAQLLADSDWLERVIGEIDLSNAEALKEELATTWVSVCSNCECPGGKRPLVVASDRCSICGGFDLQTEARKFVDAALINGRLRIIVVGRESSDHRQVRQWVSDKRLVLTQLPGSVRRARETVQTDTDHADVVVIWDPESVEAAHLEIYRKATRVGEISAGSLGSFLSEAAALIGAE